MSKFETIRNTKTQADAERTGKLDALRNDITYAREQVRRGEVVETLADAFLNRTPRKNRD